MIGISSSLSNYYEQVSLQGTKVRDWRRQWHPTPLLLPGKSHGRRSLVGCSPWGLEESDMTERLHFHFSLSCIGEGNSNPLQCSCLENPRGGRAWWAAVYGVAQSRTRLKRLSSSSSKVRDWQKRKGRFSVRRIFNSFPFSQSILVIILLLCVCMCLVTQLRLALCDLMDCSRPGSSVHGILQARVLECVAISFSRGSSSPREQICVSCIAGGSFTV